LADCSLDKVLLSYFDVAFGNTSKWICPMLIHLKKWGIRRIPNPFFKSSLYFVFGRITNLLRNFIHFFKKIFFPATSTCFLSKI